MGQRVANKPSNSFQQVCNTGYQTYPQKAVMAHRGKMKRMGCQQFDARARSLPTHAIQTPLTRPLRSLNISTAQRATAQRLKTTVEHAETPSYAMPAPRDAIEHKNYTRDNFSERGARQHRAPGIIDKWQWHRRMPTITCHA